MRRRPALSIAFAGLMLTSACAYDDATGYGPEGYAGGYDSGPDAGQYAGMGSGLVQQPGDLFGGQNVGSVAVFEEPLAPYGQWVNSRFGRAFRPDVAQEWRPYVNGQWGENRLWVSSDPWGWATDHYGRWGFDEQIGWVWTPGTEWAPSWVAFRDDPAQNVTGWAPIPPKVNYSLEYGFGDGFGYDSYDSWYAPSWVWVPRSNFYQPGFGGRVLPWRYGANYWRGSRFQYQPGWAGRPRIGGGNAYRPPNGNWPQRGQSGQRPPENAQYGQRPPQGGAYKGQYGQRPPLAGQSSGYPRGNGGGAVYGQPRPDGQAGVPGVPGVYRGNPGAQGRPGGYGQRPITTLGITPAQESVGREPQRPVPNDAAPRPMPAPQVQRAPERPSEASVPQQRIERSPGDTRNVRPE